MSMIRRNEKLERMLVWAINKAVSDDIPQLFSEYSLDTHNFLGHFRGDCINTNIRLGATTDDIVILPFRRSGYAGRLVIDRVNKTSYSVTTEQNLHSIPRKKGRRTPHFLQTLLGIENATYESECKQLTLMPMNLFDEKTLQEDFESIISNLFTPDEGYVHYIIAYTPGKLGLMDVQLLFLDKDFDVIDTHSLNGFIAPDYAELTTPQNIPNTAIDTTAATNVRSIIGLKPGLRPALYDEDNEA